MGSALQKRAAIGASVGAQQGRRGELLPHRSHAAPPGGLAWQELEQLGSNLKKG